MSEFSTISIKQLEDRLRYVVDKMETLWNNIKPSINEIEILKGEFEQIISELENRINVKKQ